MGIWWVRVVDVVVGGGCGEISSEWCLVVVAVRAVVWKLATNMRSDAYPTGRSRHLCLQVAILRKPKAAEPESWPESCEVEAVQEARAR